LREGQDVQACPMQARLRHVERDTPIRHGK